MIAGVRSDGGHGMQEDPTPDPGGRAIVWPTIVFPDYSNPFDQNAWWSYCQGLASMDRTSPWHCSLDALELYGPYELIVEVPVDISQIPSTVEILELESDEEVAARFGFEFVVSSEEVLP